MRAPLRILVTDAHFRAGLGAVRSLGRAGHTVIASYPEGWPPPPTVSSRYCSDVLRSPDPRRQQSLFREWLSDQAHRHSADAILPIDEASLVAMAAIRKDLPGDVVPILPNDGALEYSLSKFQATRMALAVDIPCPTTVFLATGPSGRDGRDELERLRFPIMIKTDNYFTATGGYERGRRFVAKDVTEAHKVLDGLADLQTRIIAQEFIRGRGAGAFLLRFNDKTHLTFAHRRLNEVPYIGGASSLRESCRDEEIIGLGEKLLDAIHYDGVAMVEFRRDAMDERPYFLEINGRLWGSLALALHCGVDFPAALVRCYLPGSSPPYNRDYPLGLKCQNLSGQVGHLRSILKARKNSGGEPPPPRLRAVMQFLVLLFDPRIRHDYFWWSDPAPGLRQAWGMVRWAGRRISKKYRGKQGRRHGGPASADVDFE